MFTKPSNQQISKIKYVYFTVVYNNLTYTLMLNDSEYGNCIFFNAG